MEQRLSFISLGVRNVASSRAFFEALGWCCHAKSTPDMPIFDIGGLRLALYDRGDLADYAGVSAFTDGNAPVILSHNVRSRSDVDVTLEKVAELGATVTRPATEPTWGGYLGFFADLDGHLWEVVWNPKWPLDEKGRLNLTID